MKKILVVIFFACLSLFSCSHKEDTKLKKTGNSPQNKKVSCLKTEINRINYPSWIEGVWHNSMESNTNNFHTFSFHENNLFIHDGNCKDLKRKQGIPLSSKSVNDPLKEKTFTLKFKEKEKTIEYEFKLQKLEGSSDSALTYSIRENGRLIRDHLTSCQLVLIKQK